MKIWMTLEFSILQKSWGLSGKQGMGLPDEVPRSPSSSLASLSDENSFWSAPEIILMIWKHLAKCQCMQWRENRMSVLPAFYIILLDRNNDNSQAWQYVSCSMYILGIFPKELDIT